MERYASMYLEPLHIPRGKPGIFSVLFNRASIKNEGAEYGSENMERTV